MSEERITRDEHGLDEIALRGVDIHLERMDDGCIWIGVYRPGDVENRLTVFLKSAETITGVIDEDDLDVKSRDKTEED